MSSASAERRLLTHGNAVILRCMTTQAIAEVRFVDGATRPVFVDTWGQQLVLDGDGNQVFGVWVKPMSAGDDPLGPDLVIEE